MIVAQRVIKNVRIYTTRRFISVLTKNMQLDPIRSELKPVHTFTVYFSMSHSVSVPYTQQPEACEVASSPGIFRLQFCMYVLSSHTRYRVIQSLFHQYHSARTQGDGIAGTLQTRYLGGSRFTSLPGHRLSSLRLFCFPSVLLGQCGTVLRLGHDSFKVLSIWSIYCHVME